MHRSPLCCRNHCKTLRAVEHHDAKRLPASAWARLSRVPCWADLRTASASPAKSSCRQASNTVTATAFERLRLLDSGRIGKRILCCGGNDSSTSGGRPRDSGPNKNVPRLIGNPVMALGALGGGGENPPSAQSLLTSRPILMNHNASVLVIIESRASQLGILKGKPMGLTRCSSQPVLAHKRITLPVLGGISG